MKFFYAITFTLFIISSQAIGVELYGLENSSRHQIEELRPAQSNDVDVKRAIKAGLFENRNIKYNVIIFKDDHGVKWTLQVFQNISKPGPTFFAPHDSEDDSFEVGIKAIDHFGGHFLTFGCAENRYCRRGIDPNRYFSTSNPTFSDTIMRFFVSKSYPVLTLHNNHDSHHKLGGRGSIFANMKEPYPGGRGVYYQGDADDLIIYSDLHPGHKSLMFTMYSEVFKELKLNNIYEYSIPSKSLGGHMSSYVILQYNLEYFNVEAQHGHGDTQFAYLLKLMSISK